MCLCVSRYMGFTGIVGHEFVGVVEEVRPSQNEEECGSSLLIGKRVVGEINLGEARNLTGENAHCHVVIATDIILPSRLLRVRQKETDECAFFRAVVAFEFSFL